MSSPAAVLIPGPPGFSVYRVAGAYHIENDRAQRSRDRYGFALSLAEVAATIKAMRR